MAFAAVALPCAAESADAADPASTVDTAESASMRAEALFAAGRAAMDEKRFEDACNAFEASERIEPAAGTLVNWAVCLEAQGKTASAWRAYRQSLELEPSEHDAVREEFARERLELLEPLLCRVRFVVSPADPPGTVLTLDGVELLPASLADGTPIDPGEHTLAAAAPGRRPWSGPFTSSDERCTDGVSVPELALAVPATSGVAQRPTAERVHTPPAQSSAQGDASRRVGLTLATGIFSGGVAGAVYFGLRARAAWSEREAHCPEHRCDAAAVIRGHEAAFAAGVADVSAVVAAGALGAGLYFALSPHGPDRAKRAEVEIRPEPHGGRINWSTVF